MEWKKRPNRKFLQNSEGEIIFTQIHEVRKGVGKEGKPSLDTESIGSCSHLCVRGKINKEPKEKSKIIAKR